jgi:hypothetical protein
MTLNLVMMNSLKPSSILFSFVQVSLMKYFLLYRNEITDLDIWLQDQINDVLSYIFVGDKTFFVIRPSAVIKLQSLSSFFSPTCPKAKFREFFFFYSNKFFHNFHLFDSSCTCPGLCASGLAWRVIFVLCLLADFCFLTLYGGFCKTFVGKKLRGWGLKQCKNW